MCSRLSLLVIAACLGACAVEKTPVHDDEVNQLIEEESPASLNR
jgi:hypothetical protein